MATAYHNLSSYDPATVPSGEDMKIGIIVAEWNDNITYALRDGACNTLLKNGVKPENILVDYVPGSFELIYGAQTFADVHELDAIIVLGSVVRGDTPHFDYVCGGVTQEIARLNVMHSIPFIFGLLTTDDMQQALDRAGGKHGNKGDECAIVALKMVDFSRRNSQ